jgi:hypothetical protein
MGDETQTPETGEPRAKNTAAQLNAERNSERLARIEEIGSGVDGRRAHELNDVDGEKVTGRFQGGEFDDSAEAAEERAAQEEAEAEQALREQAERAEAAEREAAGEARRLQEEGAPVRANGEDRESEPQAEPEPAAEPGDEKVINGVRHYLTIVEGRERWLTLKQLREQASKSAATEESLQRAHDALKQASTVALTQKEAPAEIPSDEDLENIVLSAATGDIEAVKKLVAVIKPKPSGVTPSDVSRQVSQQIATQRAIDEAEKASTDVLGNKSLEPLFRMRLREVAQTKPNLKIQDAYAEVAKGMRTEFAPMLKTTPAEPTKAEKKRTIVNPPQSAGRLPAKPDDDQEVPIGTQIDQIAKSRGQERAYRQGRR